MTVEELASRATVFYDVGVGDTDPTRRQLFDRAQQAGRRLTPRVEVETLVMALRLVADGLGDTYLPKAHTRAWHFPPGLTTTSFAPPVHDTLALVTRADAALSPAMRRFVERVEEHFATVAAELDGSP